MLREIVREWRRLVRGKRCEGCGRKYLRAGAHRCSKKATPAEMDEHLKAAGIR